MVSPVVAAFFRPVRVCPVPWCGCPHREPGDDARCRECRRRPAGAEVHGLTRTTLHSDAWAGEWGCSYTLHAMSPEDGARHKADRALCEAAAKALGREELLAWLASVGREAPTALKIGQLREAAARAQLELWWPRSFVQRTALATA